MCEQSRKGEENPTEGWILREEYEQRGMRVECVDEFRRGSQIKKGKIMKDGGRIFYHIRNEENKKKEYKLNKKTKIYQFEKLLTVLGDV